MRESTKRIAAGEDPDQVRPHRGAARRAPWHMGLSLVRRRGRIEAVRGAHVLVDAGRRRSSQAAHCRVHICCAPRAVTGERKHDGRAGRQPRGA
eukprot:7338173-Prymnesium_polylepis.2